jgi:very-short-patch-repair endonuclease
MLRIARPSASRKQLLEARAHGPRHAPTASESKLWAELSGGKLGVTFRRQVPVGHRYIVDFLAPALKLVVEVDGGAHEYRRRADARRDDWLRRRGFRVVRVGAADVIQDVGTAVTRIVRDTALP